MAVISGQIFNGKEFIYGSVHVENGVVTSIEECSKDHSMTGFIVPSLVNCHTHAGDAGLQIKEKMSLEELVAPPDGLKHRYLEETSNDVVVKHMKKYLSKMSLFGTGMFADFREGGKNGAELLKSVPGPDRLIFGRPVSKEYDGNEIDDILDISDGIGISSISDIPSNYVDAIADHVHKRKKKLAIHVSERVREDIEKVISICPDLIIHMNGSSDNDMRRCADENVPVIVCPRSNRYFGKISPVGRLLNAGVTVGLGTDNAMLCDPDLRAECTILAELLKGRPDIDDKITEILLMNGRKILNDGMEMGIKVGMDAGISVFPSKNVDGIGDLIRTAGRHVLTVKECD